MAPAIHSWHSPGRGLEKSTVCAKLAHTAKDGKAYKKAVMKKSGRYKTSSMIEDQYEPGSRGRVLKNLPGITTKKGIDTVETREYLRVTDQLLQHFDRKIVSLQKIFALCTRHGLDLFINGRVIIDRYL